MAADDPCYLTIVEAARLLRARTLSPVELTRALLERIEVHDGRVQAFLHVAAAEALDAAHAAEHALASGQERGPHSGLLGGVPLAIKDIVDVAGLPTTAGSRALAGRIAAADAALVAALRAAGAIILGKTNTHEFAYGVITPPTRNPWDLERIPGGSSGGSAAALAAGMVPGAVGTDTAGSIRLPAALCGIVGLKPTYGRVDCRGVIPLSWSLDHAGPMARSVADVAILFAVMTTGTVRPSTQAGDASTLMEELERPVRGLRAGVPRPYFFEGLEPGVGAAVEAALAVLSDLGVELREVELPDVDLTFAVGRAVQRPEASAYHRQRLRAMPALYGPEVRADLEVGELFLATDYIHAQRVREGLRRRWLAVMDGLDVLLTPTVPIVAPLVDYAGMGATVKGPLLHNTYPFNLVGFPALSLPCGLTEDGLPVGLQIAGRPDDEATVLRAGHAFETATRWHTLRPPLGA